MIFISHNLKLIHKICDEVVFLKNGKLVEKGKIKKDKLNFSSNFDYKKIQSLFSNLSSLSLIELFELRQNYKSLGYSTIEVDVQIQRIVSLSLIHISEPTRPY